MNNPHQKAVDEWISKYKLGYFEPLAALARLTEETGEIAREINHLFGPKKKKDSEDTAGLEMELGDLLFTMCCIANPLNLDLDRALTMAIEKYNSRDKNRWEEK